MPNLSSYELSDKQLIFICQVMNQSQLLENVVHVGKVPLLDQKLVTACLLAYRRDFNNPDKKRLLAKVLLAKFNTDVPVRKMVTFDMYLNPAKVFRLAGLREIKPRHYTVKLPFNAKVEVGIRWDAFKKKWVYPVELRNFHAELELLDLKQKLFRFKVPASCSERTKEWLVEKCGLIPPSSTELKPTRNVTRFLRKRRR